VDNSGCRLCYRPTLGSMNVGNRPVCRRFCDANNCDGGIVRPHCDDEACCLKQQNPNPTDGNGYLQFEESCKNGGLHCVENSGCQLCWMPRLGFKNVGERPICTRFCDLKPFCEEDDCCIKHQKLNCEEDNDFLEFNETCNHGGSHCVEKSGCRSCFNPSLGHVRDRKICKRFGDYKPPEIVCSEHNDFTTCKRHSCNWCSFDGSSKHKGYCHHPNTQSCCGKLQLDCQEKPVLCNVSDTCCSPLFHCRDSQSPSCCPRGTSCCSSGRFNTKCCDSKNEICCSPYSRVSTCCPKESSCCGTYEKSWCCPKGKVCLASTYGCR